VIALLAVFFGVLALACMFEAGTESFFRIPRFWLLLALFFQSLALYLLWVYR
jgi:hypothetical protein